MVALGAFGAFLDPRALPQLLAVALMLVLAGGLLATRFNDRVNRAFALFLVLRGLSMGLAALGAVEPDPVRSDYWSRVGGYFHLAAYPALLAFVAVYPKRWRIARQRWAAIALFVMALSLVLAYAIDKCIWLCPDPVSGLTAAGPAAAVHLALVLSIAGLYFVREHLAAEPGPRREALLIVGCVFVLNALFDGTRALSDLRVALDVGFAPLGLTPTPWAWASFVAAPLALIPSLLAVGLLVHRWVRDGLLASRGRRVFLTVVVLAFASGLLVGLVSQGVLKRSWSIFVLGLWRVSLPIGVTYAILRYQLFDIDLKVKLTIERSALVAVFGAAFFVGSELLEKLLPFDSVLLGIASAGLIALALKPIERYAHRLADNLLPTVKEKSPDYLADRKLDVYRAAVESALEDGDVSAKERSVLERLRGKLGIAPDDASRVEVSLGLHPMQRGPSPA